MLARVLRVKTPQWRWRDLPAVVGEGTTGAGPEAEGLPAGLVAVAGGAYSSLAQRRGGADSRRVRTWIWPSEIWEMGWTDWGIACAPMAARTTMGREKRMLAEGCERWVVVRWGVEILG